MGENCSAGSRILVQDSAVAEVVDRAAVGAAALAVGDPADPANRIGPLISRAARDRVHGLVQRARSAIRQANDTEYGLAASMWTKDVDAAHRMARAIRAGTVSVNCYREGDMTVPFGGYRQSGFGGKEKSLAAFDQWTQTKTVWVQTH
jgi:gamma-glutamyl-gamma-aminobutyraldehyde dehydrogenase